MTRPLAEIIASEVRAEMGRQRVSGRRLARMLGMNHQQMADRLKGVVEIRPNELQAIAEHLGVPVSQLMHEPSDAGSAA